MKVSTFIKITFVLTLFAMGCGTVTIPKGYVKYSNQEDIYVKHDDIYGWTYYKPKKSFTENRYGDYNYRMPPVSAYISRKGNQINFMVEIYYNGGDWLFLERACLSDKAGTNIFYDPSTRVTRETGYCSAYGCLLYEYYTVIISRAQINQLAKLLNTTYMTKLFVRLEGSKSYLDLELHNADIIAILTMIDLYDNMVSGKVK